MSPFQCAFGALALLSLASQSAMPQQITTPWLTAELFPERLIVPVFAASPVAPICSAGEIFESSHVAVSLGGEIPAAEIVHAGIKFQLSASASVKATLDPPALYNLINSDFTIDFVRFDIVVNPEWILRFGPGHTSHHLSDNAYELLGYSKSFQYSRDYWQTGVYYVSGSGTAAYAGGLYNYSFISGTNHREPWILRGGIEQTIIDFGYGVFGYAGLDIESFQDLSFAASQNYQIGVFRNTVSNGKVRLALQLQTGLDSRGQFYGRRIRTTMAVLIFEL